MAYRDFETILVLNGQRDTIFLSKEHTEGKFYLFKVRGKKKLGRVCITAHHAKMINAVPPEEKFGVAEVIFKHRKYDPECFFDGRVVNGRG